MAFVASASSLYFPWCLLISQAVIPSLVLGALDVFPIMSPFLLLATKKPQPSPTSSLEENAI